MNKIRVILADDHTLVRKGLKALLAAYPHIEVVGEAADGREAVQLAEALRPHVVVMDINMPGLNGLEATDRIKRRCPEVNVLILSMHANEEYVLQVLRSGASGYLLKDSATEDLVAGIQAVTAGEAYLSPRISKTVIAEYVRRTEAEAQRRPHELLTPREREILQLIAEGRTSKEIASELHLSIKTVETHRANLMDKLNIHNRAGLIRYAIRAGIIPPDQ
ncbi:MAG: DNA-binding response regulator [Chloroflexota bacterium]